MRRLLEVLGRLVDAGNTVVVIEHNLDVVKCADWVIDLGPGAGDEGGRVVASGTPETVARSRRSQTARYLRPLLARRSGDRLEDRGRSTTLSRKAWRSSHTAPPGRAPVKSLISK